MYAPTFRESRHPQQQEEQSNVVAFNCEIKREMNWFDFRV